jgi:hypothetical protein
MEAICATPTIGQDLRGMLQQMMAMMSQIISGGGWSMWPPLVVATSFWFQAKVEWNRPILN